MTAVQKALWSGNLVATPDVVSDATARGRSFGVYGRASRLAVGLLAALLFSDKAWAASGNLVATTGLLHRPYVFMAIGSSLEWLKWGAATVLATRLPAVFRIQIQWQPGCHSPRGTPT